MPRGKCITGVVWAAAVVCVIGATAPSARADHQPAIVVPGRPDVPVIIDGVDARGSVVVGDWGLYRPGFAPMVEPGPLLVGRGPLMPGYFPATGRRPRYGRLEIEPRAGRRPAPVRSFYRAWSSEPSPVSLAAYPSPDPPAVIAAPRTHRLKPRARPRLAPFR